MGNNTIDPNREWANKNFGDAVLASGVGWMVVQWEINYEPSICRNREGCHDYSMFPNQFNDMPKDMPYEEVRAIFDAHVANRVEHNAKTNRDTDPVRISLFLLKVETVVNITDDHGNLIQPASNREIPNG
jgi:hypothetical protein